MNNKSKKKIRKIIVVILVLSIFDASIQVIRHWQSPQTIETEQKENADSIAAIIKNPNGLYTFVEMKKQFASGNVVRHVWPLITEDAGYSEAKKLLEEFK